MQKWFDLEQYRKIFRFVGPRSIRYLAFGVVTGVVLSGVEVLFAYVLQSFLVVMKIVQRESMNFPSWLPVDGPFQFLCFVSLVLIARAVIVWLHNYLLRLADETQREFQRIRLLSWAFTSKSVNSAEVLSLYATGISSLCSTLVNFQNIAIILSTAMFIFFYLLKISFLISSLSIGILLVLAVITRRLDVHIAAAGRTMSTESEQINRSLLSHFKNLLLLQIYGTQELEKKRVEERVKKTLEYQMAYNRIVNLKTIIPQTLGKILIFGLCIIATQKSWLPSGLMITYFYLFLQFVTNFAEVVRLGSAITFNRPAATKFATWWADHAPDGVRSRVEIKEKVKAESLHEAIGWKLENVDFAYSKDAKPILKGFDLEIPARQCVVLVGESGSGKSTIIALLLGLVDPVAGSVSVLGERLGVRKLSEVQSSLLESVGYVGPESFLVDGTIRENIMYGLSYEPSTTEIEHALKIADCQFVQQFPKYLDHHITEQGQGLSAGQKQRLSFARALLRKPKILILDEATANLDIETEQRFVNTLKDLKGSVTIVAVTHREALLEIADKVVKLKANQS